MSITLLACEMSAIVQLRLDREKRSVVLGNSLRPTCYFLKGSGKPWLHFCFQRVNRLVRQGGYENGDRVLRSSVWGSFSSGDATREGFFAASIGPSW